MAMLAIVRKNGDIQTFDTDDDEVMLVLVLSLLERHRVFETAAKKHEIARDNPGETNNVLHIFAAAKLDTAEKHGAFLREQYRARDSLAQRKNFRDYMLEQIRNPTAEASDQAVNLAVPSRNLILPG